MMYSRRKKVIVVWFSCGAASAVAAKLTLEKYASTHNVLIVNNPIKEEDEDNLRFKYDVEKWLGVSIVEAKAKKFPSASIVDVFKKLKYMSGVLGASCTLQLKKQARYEFELKNNIDFHVLGFTYDEIERHNRFTKFERPNVIPVLIQEKIRKADCFRILKAAGIKLPRIYSLKFPNANCIGCVKAQSPTYWNMVRTHFPKVFIDRGIQSRELGCKLVKLHGKRIFLDELKETDKGGKIKSWECGIFCDSEKY